jgi:hypothetical protein
MLRGNTAATSLGRPPAFTTAGRRPEGSDGWESAKARSRVDWKRFDGFFSRQRRTSRSSQGGTSASVCEGASGSSRRMAVIDSAAVPRAKARRPVSIS